MTKLVFLDDPAASPRNKKRAAITEELIGRDTAGVKHFSGKGADVLQRAFYLIWLGDFTSYYLARLGHVDPMPVKRIEKLKARLK
jgi:glucose/mannose-6-phosphate isomerase